MGFPEVGDLRTAIATYAEHLESLRILLSRAASLRGSIGSGDFPSMENEMRSIVNAFLKLPEFPLETRLTNAIGAVSATKSIQSFRPGLVPNVELLDQLANQARQSEVLRKELQKQVEGLFLFELDHFATLADGLTPSSGDHLDSLGNQLYSWQLGKDLPQYILKYSVSHHDHTFSNTRLDSLRHEIKDRIRRINGKIDKVKI